MKRVLERVLWCCLAACGLGLFVASGCSKEYEHHHPPADSSQPPVAESDSPILPPHLNAKPGAPKSLVEAARDEAWQRVMLWRAIHHTQQEMDSTGSEVSGLDDKIDELRSELAEAKGLIAMLVRENEKFKDDYVRARVDISTSERKVGEMEEFLGALVARMRQLESRPPVIMPIPQRDDPFNSEPPPPLKKNETKDMPHGTQVEARSGLCSRMPRGRCR